MQYLDQIIAYENGELESQEVIDLFQAMINDGMVWNLQGHYQRIAMSLIESGLCHTPQEQKNA